MSEDDPHHIKQIPIKVRVLLDDIFHPPPQSSNLNDDYEYLKNNKKNGWVVGKKQYVFDVKRITDDEIINNGLEDIDVLIIGGIDKYIDLYLGKNLKQFEDDYNSWIKNVSKFICNGGGCICICGGAQTFCELDCSNDSRITFNELMMKKTSVPITDIKVKTKTAIPLLHQLLPKNNPGDIGNCAYLIYPGYNEFHVRDEHDDNSKKKFSKKKFLGLTLDFKINSDSCHPIFKGYGSENIKMRWVGGPSICNVNDKNILLHYPEDSSFDDYEINQWKYIGTRYSGLVGKLNGLKEAILKEFNEDKKPGDIVKKNLPKTKIHDSFIEEFLKNIYIENKNNKDILKNFYNGILKAKDWKKIENKYIRPDVAGKPAIVAEECGKGRIVISGPHPEMKIWDGGKIVQKEDKGDNCLFKGLYSWNPEPKIDEDRLNYWFFRRIVAWAAGFNEDMLPPFPGDNGDGNQGGDNGGKGGDKESWITSLIDFLKRLFRIKS